MLQRHVRWRIAARQAAPMTAPPLSQNQKGNADMPLQTPLDLFLHEMGDIYDAEQRIAQILPTLASEATDTQAQSAYQQHLTETQQQIQNLEQCFQALGTQPTRQTCAAVAGLKQEHDTFLKEQPTDQVLGLFDLGAAAKTEHYEIASYQGLIEQAKLLGQQQCAQLLQQNLQQEQAMLQRVTQLSQQLGQQAASQMPVSHMGQAGASAQQPTA
jgi:ferritin-like metal-binding protein YciE